MSREDTCIAINYCFSRLIEPKGQESSIGLLTANLSTHTYTKPGERPFHPDTTNWAHHHHPGSLKSGSNIMKAILNLPVELSLSIFSNLSAKEIQRVRRVCKHYRSLIDNKDNRSLLTMPGLMRSIMAFKTNCDATYLIDVRTTNLYQYLFRVLECRGLRNLPDYTSHTALIAAQGWVLNCPKLRAKQDAPNYELSVIILQLAIIARGLISAHISQHQPEFRPLLRVQTLKDFERDFEGSQIATNPEFEELGITKTVCSRWYQNIRDQAVGVTNIPAEPSRLPLAEFVLTRLRYCAHDSEPQAHNPVGFKHEHEVGGLCSTHQLGEVLNLKVMSVGQRFAYCVKSQRTYDMLEAAILCGRILSELERATVMEELHLY